MYDYDAFEYRPLNLSSEELFFDEFRFLVYADITVVKNVMYINLIKFEMDAPNKYGTRQYPHRNTMGLSVNEYHEWILQF